MIGGGGPPRALAAVLLSLHYVAAKRLLHARPAPLRVKADLVVAARLRDDDDAVWVCGGEPHQAAPCVLLSQLVLRKGPLRGEVLGQRDGHVTLHAVHQTEQHSITAAPADTNSSND